MALPIPTKHEDGMTAGLRAFVVVSNYIGTV